MECKEAATAARAVSRRRARSRRSARARSARRRLRRVPGRARGSRPLRHAMRADAPRYAAPASLRERIRREAPVPAYSPRMRRMPAWSRLAAACFGAFVAGAGVMHFAAGPVRTRAMTLRAIFSQVIGARSRRLRQSMSYRATAIPCGHGLPERSRNRRASPISPIRVFRSSAAASIMSARRACPCSSTGTTST